MLYARIKDSVKVGDQVYPATFNQHQKKYKNKIINVWRVDRDDPNFPHLSGVWYFQPASFDNDHTTLYYPAEWLTIQAEQLELPLFENAPVKLDAIVKNIKPGTVEYALHSKGKYPVQMIFNDYMRSMVGKKIVVSQLSNIKHWFRDTKSGLLFHESWLDFSPSKEGDQTELPLFESNEPTVTATVNSDVKVGDYAGVYFKPMMKKYIGKRVKLKALGAGSSGKAKFYQTVVPDIMNGDKYYWIFCRDWLTFDDEREEQQELPLFESKSSQTKIRAMVRPDISINDHIGNCYVNSEMATLAGKWIYVRPINPADVYFYLLGKDWFIGISDDAEGGYAYHYHKSWLKFSDNKEGEQIELPLFN